MKKKTLLSFFICAFISLQIKGQTITNYSLPKQITQHSFNFKGFALTLNDDVADEKGNHLLAGEIHAFEKEEQDRDTMINRVFELKGVVYDDKLGILITTDKNYKITKIVRSFIGEKIMYDTYKKQFTIGALFFDYLKVDGRSFSAWQPVIITTDITLKARAFFVQRPYSCILKNIIIEKDKIKIFARSNSNVTDNKSDEKAEVITVSLSKTHVDTARPWIKVLDILSILQTPHNDRGRLELSDISKIGNDYYFSTYNLNQFNLKTSNHLYCLTKDKLTEKHSFADVLKLSHNFSDWININEFFAAETNFISLTHTGATKKEIIYTKTDTLFNVLLQKKIPLNDYADFYKMSLLPNGNTLLVAVNKTESWSYYLYDKNMELLKEIDSNISKKYYPQNLQSISNTAIKCIFYIDNVNKKDCLLQTVSVN
ncbi:MAG: hypothetical protein JNJ40_04530 [Bacteroidia bacterium]|nr:hypothetical protein [Bacteroidia bacterium]